MCRNSTTNELICRANGKNIVQFMRLNVCMQFTFGDKGEVYLQNESALPVTRKESVPEGNRASALG